MFEPNCVVVLLAPELTLKSAAVRAFMQARLKKNILLCLKNKEVPFSKMVFMGGRYLVYSTDPMRAVLVLGKCFGVHALYLAQESTFTNLDEIAKKAADVSMDSIKEGTFAIRGKSFTKEFSSKKLEEELGGALLDAHPALKVKLKNPEQELYCLTHKDKAIFYFKELPAARGMPLGSQGRAGLIVDNYDKKDLVKLGLLLMKTGCCLIVVGSEEYTIKELEEWNSFQRLKFAPFNKAKEYYAHEGIRAFFSPARTIEEARRDLELVGVKVFAPFLVG